MCDCTKCISHRGVRVRESWFAVKLKHFGLIPSLEAIRTAKYTKRYSMCGIRVTRAYFESIIAPCENICGLVRGFNAPFPARLPTHPDIFAHLEIDICFICVYVRGSKGSGSSRGTLKSRRARGRYVFRTAKTIIPYDLFLRRSVFEQRLHSIHAC